MFIKGGKAICWKRLSRNLHCWWLYDVPAIVYEMMHATGNFFSRVFMRWTNRSNDHRVPLSHVLVRRSRFACRTPVSSILHGWGCSTIEVRMTFLLNSFQLCFIALRYKNFIFNVSEPNCTICELVIAIYEGITIKREWVARTGTAKWKKGRIGAEVIDRGTV